MEPLPQSIRDQIRKIASRHGATNIRLFGSRARGDASASSDIDLLVDMDSERSLIDLIALERELETALDLDVDLLTPGSLSPYLRDQVEREAVPL